MRIALATAVSIAFACSHAVAQTKTAPPAPAPAAVAAVAPAAAVMKPGLWELTTMIDTAGSITKRTVVGRACYSAIDVADVRRVIPQQREFGMQCENRDPKSQGPAATWNVVCTSKEGTLNGSGKLTMASTTYSGKAELELKKRGAKPVKVEQTVSGKWIETCK